MFGWLRAGGIAAAVIALGASAFVGSATAAVGNQNGELGVGFQSVETFGMTSATNGQVASIQSEPVESSAPLAPEVPVAPITLDATIAPRASKATLASIVASHKAAEAASREIECLATAIYYESKSEALAGQLAVGQVIRNRATSGRFPKSMCGVVLQRSQFSFVRGGRLPVVPRASAQWRTAVAVAKVVADGLHEDIVPKALFFHARHVSPGWKLKRLQSVGNHVFYR